MFWVDVDKESGINMIHRADCIHLVPENNPDKQFGEVGETGGYFEFPTVGLAVRYLKTKRISGLIHHCPYCKPTKKFNPEPAASFGVEVTPTGCETTSIDSPVVKKAKKTVDVTDTKTIFKRLSEKLFGNR